MIRIENYIGGEWVPTRQVLENREPATGEVFSTLPDSSAEDVTAAILAAESAFQKWGNTPVRERAEFLRKISSGIRARQSEFAQAESRDTGKPLRLAESVDIPRACLNFEFFADAITQFASEFYETPTSMSYTSRSPLGVVGCISPWNLPLYLLSWKVAPALAAGNTVVAKPSEITPLTAHLLSQVCHEIGLPKGVLNLVHGKGDPVGTALSCHPKVRAISFTGSTATGGRISSLAAPLFKKLSLEMGGKNPTLIFADANLDVAIPETIRAAFSNQGQICLCGSRILVEKSIYPEVRERLIDQTRKLRVGDPLDAGTDQGAVVSQSHFEKILRSIELAKSEGGKLLWGGSAVKVSGRCENGWFVNPTLIEGLSPSCVVNQEEVFGPFATLIPFETEAEALEIANDIRYGLSATVWTQSLQRAHLFAKKLEVGMVWINGWMIRDLRTPFGGTKDSGVGREGGLDALRFFTEQKSVCLHLGG